MKLVIASDIHGAARWCERLLAAIEAEAPDRVVLLGDLLYHGPRNDLSADYAPKRVIEMLNDIADLVVAARGNCEAEVDQMVLGFSCLRDYVPLFDGQRRIFCTHGHVWGPGLDGAIDRMPTLAEGDVLLYGHTHVKVLDTRGGVRIFNPGSVGIPKDGSHSFGIYEDGRLAHRILGQA